MLCTRHTTHHEATRSSAAVRVYLWGSFSSIAIQGCAQRRRFAPVAQPHNLDRLGPGS